MDEGIALRFSHDLGVLGRYLEANAGVDTSVEWVEGEPHLEVLKGEEQFPVWCAGPKGLFVWDRGNGRHEGEVIDILKNLGRK